MVSVRKSLKNRSPERMKLNKELANILSGNTYEEKLETANSLQIEATERVGKFNANQRPTYSSKICQ